MGSYAHHLVERLAGRRVAEVLLDLAAEAGLRGPGALRDLRRTPHGWVALLGPAHVRVQPRRDLWELLAPGQAPLALTRRELARALRALDEPAPLRAAAA
ncbi:hypothetical protein [Vallicoccus soli]|uniref:Uncharacterized protein n=1 Tax=Vallicoccus soli TaxID=2339232 RepID=A0A3A3YZY2_9ACTN|nr:hypothetical protein [Vallicoccus soli]RJK97530.1 hypothetical protein D5H78_00320 [Vallicoccus soli]